MKNKIVLVLFIIVFLSACGGGGGSFKTQTPTPTPTPTILTADELALSRLQGLWKGELKVFIEGTDTPQCVWNISLNLSPAKIPDSIALWGSVFKGDASAELIFDKSTKCKSGTMSIDWSASCISDEYLKNYKQSLFSCGVRLDDADYYNSDEIYGSQNLSSLLGLGSVILSYDKKTIIRYFRSNRDEPYLHLKRERLAFF